VVRLAVLAAVAVGQVEAGREAVGRGRGLDRPNEEGMGKGVRARVWMYSVRVREVVGWLVRGHRG